MKTTLCSAFFLVCSCLLLAVEPIVSFEPGESWRDRLNPQSVKLEVVKENAGHGQHSAKVFFAGSAVDTWPGFSVKLSPEDYQDEINLLTFSVWHEEKDSMGISWRIDVPNGPAIFGGTNIPPRNRRRISLQIGRKDLEGNPVQASNVTIYRRMPREDCTYWVDDFRLEASGWQFTAIDYHAPTAHRTPTNQETELGYQLFQRPWQEHVFKNTLPAPSDGAIDLSASACPGEQEPMVFSLHALTELKDVAVTVQQPLCLPSGEAIPNSAIEILPIRCLDKRTTYPAKDYYRDLPVLLERRAKVDITAGESKTFWIDIDVPPQTRAGMYRGMLALSVNGRQTSLLRFQLQVFPFTLDEPTDMFWGEYYHGARNTTTPEETRQKLIEDMTAMRKNGMNSIGVCVAPTVIKDKSKWQDGKVEFALVENCNFVQMMNLYFELGYTMPIIQLSDFGQTFCSSMRLEYGSEEYKACYKAFWKAMQDEVKKRSWPEMLVQPVDEPGWQSKHSRELNKTLLQYLKEIPGQRTEQDGPGDNYFIHEAGPWADMWNFNGALGNAGVMAKLAEEKRLAVLYNCDVESYRPEVGRYVNGFFQARSKSQGYYNWAFLSISSNPYDDFDSEYGDFSHIYPPSATEPGGPSLGWYGTREGIDDYKYLTTLRNLIKSRQTGNTLEQKLAKEAQATIDDLLASLRYSPAIRNRAVFSQVNLTSGQRGVTGVLKLPNGWKFHHYDLARKVLVKQIYALLHNRAPVAEAAPSVSMLPKQASAVTAVAPKTQYQVTVPMITSPPKIDGDLSDPAWAQAGRLENFSINTGGTPLGQTHARIMSDGTYLYLGAVCDEIYMDKIITQITDDGGPVWNDDCVEFFFDPDLQGLGYYQLVVNALGKHTFINQINQKKMTPKITAAAQSGNNHWSVEVRLPLADLGIPGKSFGFNVCRERRPLEVLELTCWSPTGSMFGTPKNFGVAHFGQRGLHLLSDSALNLGANAITVQVRNDLAKADTFQVIGAWTTETNKETSQQTRSVTLEPGQTSTVELNYQAASAGTVNQVLTLQDSQGTVIDRQTSTPTVPAPLSINASAPFVDGPDWQLEIAVNLAPDLRAGQELVLSTESHGILARSPLQQDSQFVIKLASGAFNCRETITAQLQSIATGKAFSKVSQVVFTP